jgi:outer membrane protein
MWSFRPSRSYGPTDVSPRFAPILVACSVGLACLSVGTTGGAQPRQPEKPAPAAPPLAPPAPVDDMMQAKPGGVTSDQVATRAAATSYQARAAEETANAASARAEQAWSNYLPRVGLTARYTRLSDFTAPSFGAGGVGSPAPGGSCVANCPPGVPTTAAPLFVSGGFPFPLILDQYLTQATIAVPISDYFLKISRAYTASTHQEEAARFDVTAARAKSFSDGKVAYFTWLRARGAATVAQQSLAVAHAHQKDAENQFAVGNASKADVLRAQTAVAAAELLVERAKSGIVITERQIRIATHAKEEEQFEPGESLEGQLPNPPPALKALVTEAHQQRPEIKSIDKNAEATRKLADASRAAKWPALSAFGDVTYANPNQRKFPQSQEWFPTWAVGAQITWSPNDVIAASPAGADLEARAAALDAQKAAIRDGIELEVTQAYQAVVEADIAITTTTRQLESATEGYRVARELFNAGRGTATTLIDAETALAQTRFDHLNARVDARVARIRLDHALGRDVRGVNPAAPPAP